jgi:hypothetical protein
MTHWIDGPGSEVRYDVDPRWAAPSDVRYYAIGDTSAPRVLWRVGPGFEGHYAHADTGWRWTSDLTGLRPDEPWKGLHWTVSGMGGDGPPGPEIPAAEAIEILRANGGEPDAVDRAAIGKRLR